MATHRKLAAIFSADAAGYSRLMADDEAETLRALNESRALFRKRIEAHAGRLIDTAGDSILAELLSPVEAVDCANEIQHELAKRNSQLAEHRRMQFRIGINLGDVIVQEDGTIYGDGVNVAARLQQLAEPGEICVSGTAFDQVDGKLPLAFKFIGEQQVKNIAKPVRAYRVMPPVSVSKARRLSPGARRRMAILTSVVAAFVLAAGILLTIQRPDIGRVAGKSEPGTHTGTSKPRLAVLPLANISPNPDDEYFSDGMTEELISRLSRLGGLDVIARTSVMQYKGKDKSVADIGRELNVSTVLEGSVRKAGDKVRITVQLIDVSSQGHQWSQDYDRELKDIFSTQRDISEQVANALHVKLVATGPGPRSAGSEAAPKTYALYLKGRYHAGKLTPDGLRTSIRYFEEALAESPNDANVWAGLARTYALLGWWAYASPNESFAKAKSAAEKALSLDESLSEAHIALGMLRFLSDWDWRGARQAYLRAIDLSPANADAHLFHGILLKALAMNDQAVAEIRRANELDPLNLMANAEIGWVAYYGRRFEEAVQGCRRTLEMDPNYLFALSCLQTALTLKKDPEAITLAKKMVELTSGDPYFLSQLGWAHGVLGDREEAQRILDRLNSLSRSTSVPPPAMYYVHLGLGNRDATFEFMEKAYRERWSDMAWIRSAPEYDSIRSDARFAALLTRMQFPE